MSRFMNLIYILLLSNTVRSGQRCSEVGPCKCTRVVDKETQKPIHTLDCQDKGLNQIPIFDRDNNVDTVLLGRNNIQRIPANAFKNLSPRNVDLRYNKINRLDEDAFGGVEKIIRTLDLRNNKLQTIPERALRKARSLRQLRLDQNHIKEVQERSFRDLRALNALTMSACRIQDIRSGAFKGLKRLKYLDISDNNIARIGGTLRDLVHLDVLNISKSGINKMPIGSLMRMRDLRELYVRNTEIRSLPLRLFKTMAKLTVFDFSGNTFLHKAKYLNAISLLNATLEVLNIANCSINRWPSVISTLHQLKTLDISNNDIKAIPPDGLTGATSLQHISIRRNDHFKFTHEMFKGVEDTLLSVDMGSLRLKQLPTDNLITLKRLQKVDVSYNNIEEIKAGFFDGVRANEYVFIHNQIRTVTSDAFLNLSTPQPLSIDFTGNKIRIITFIEDNVCKFRSLDLSKNPIACGCGTYELTLRDSLKLRGVCHGLSGESEFSGVNMSSDIMTKNGEEFCGGVEKPEQCPISVTPLHYGNGKYNNGAYTIANDNDQVSSGVRKNDSNSEPSKASRVGYMDISVVSFTIMNTMVYVYVF